MSGTDDMIAFYRARLDEEELWAIEASRRGSGAAVPGGVHWQWEDSETDEVVTLDPGQSEYAFGVSLRSREVWPTHSVGELPQFAISMAEEVPTAVGGYIARHDPARTLKRIEQARKILDDHAEVNDGSCGTCVDGGWGYPTHGGSSPQRYPCRTLRLAVEVYDDHPEYQESWRP